MKAHVISVPYDSGRRGWRLGAGPVNFLAAGIIDELRVRHDVTQAEVALEGGDQPEIAGAFSAAAAIASQVRRAFSEDRLPIVLAGNCASSWGTVSAIREFEPAILWFDAHGDLNTPETTRSGMLDGMALAVLTGRCWREMTAGIDGFRAVRDRNVVLVGARDLDPAEHELVATGDITLATQPAALEEKLEDLHMRCRVAYVHVDLDVLDPGIGRANQFAAPGGLSQTEIVAALQLIARYLPIAAVNITAYDPAVDSDRAAGRVGIDLIRAIPDLAAQAVPEQL